MADLSVKVLETRFCILTYQLVLYAERDVNGSVLWQGIISLCPSLIFFFLNEIAKSREKWLENTKEVKVVIRLMQLRHVEQYSRMLEIFSRVTYKLESRNVLDKMIYPFLRILRAVISLSLRLIAQNIKEKTFLECF